MCSICSSSIGSTVYVCSEWLVVQLFWVLVPFAPFVPVQLVLFHMFVLKVLLFRCSMCSGSYVVLLFRFDVFVLKVLLFHCSVCSGTSVVFAFRSCSKALDAPEGSGDACMYVCM